MIGFQYEAFLAKPKVIVMRADGRTIKVRAKALTTLDKEYSMTHLPEPGMS